MKRSCILLILNFTFLFFTSAQSNRWQQKVKYIMDVKLDVSTNKITGTQQVTYTNNSPDTLSRVFIHLYWNAFKPNSMMDISTRSTENLVLGKSVSGNAVTDFDKRFINRVATLSPSEQGYCQVLQFAANGKNQQFKEHETILEVDLEKPVLPGTSVIFSTRFECQVPKLARRSGRDSPEGIRYSLGQWYPKICEYDEEGWHTDDYTGHEFYGVWGDYDVDLTLDKNYKVGATGILQNAKAIGWGYDVDGSPLAASAGVTRTWKFSAKNVHDFVWAADPDYKHITRKIPGGPVLHFIYKNNVSNDATWQATADTCALIYPFMAKTFGVYPYPVYSFLQGGGGGTEYPMASLIKSPSLETAIHEFCHSWYQMMLGTNENLYAWMDEGFADYAEARVLAWLHKKDFFANAREYDYYFRLAESRFDEPMSTPANFYNTNYAYNNNAYYKGAVFLRQLGYIVGESQMDKILIEYYKAWRFKHPEPNDFIRIAEKVTGMQLQWYKQLMVYTTKTVDYGIDSLWEENGVSKIRLKRVGEMPMPIDLELRFKDGSKELHYIPLSLMYGTKPAETDNKPIVHEEWKWIDPTYIVEFKRRLTDLKEAEIDPTRRLADIERKNNLLQLKW
jgi:hypothetical protein